MECSHLDDETERKSVDEGIVGSEGKICRISLITV
jgi:hypothetical protein